MTILPNVDYFKELPFLNIYIDKPKIKRLKNIDLLTELPFYDQLNIIRTEHAFSSYEMSYKVEIVDKKDLIVQLEASNNICVNVFCYKNKLVFPVYISNQTFKSSIDLLLLIDDDKSHSVYIKDFNTFMFHKTKNENKKWFCKSCLQCFSSENVLIKHKEDCLSINGQQSINLEKGTIEFKNYFKQLPVPFKIYPDFECNLKDVECFEGTYTKKYYEHVPCSYAYEVVCIDNKYSKPIVVYRDEDAAYKFIKAILKERKYCKK